MREHYDPVIARRIWRNTIIGLIGIPLIVYWGMVSAGPAESLPWAARGFLVVVALYFVPALYLTLRFKFRLPSALALLGALAGPAAVAWFWCFRWISFPQVDTSEFLVRGLLPGLSCGAIGGLVGCWSVGSWLEFQRNYERLRRGYPPEKPRAAWAGRLAAVFIGLLIGGGFALYHASRGRVSLVGGETPLSPSCILILLAGWLAGSVCAWLTSRPRK